MFRSVQPFRVINRGQTENKNLLDSLPDPVHALIIGARESEFYFRIIFFVRSAQYSRDFFCSITKIFYRDF